MLRRDDEIVYRSFIVHYGTWSIVAWVQIRMSTEIIDDLVLIAESMEELIEKFKKWEEGTKTKGIRLNMNKAL